MATLVDVMTRRPQTCMPQDSLVDAARIMREEDCGIVPIVEDRNTMRLVGLITDRDIVVRAVASGRDPRECAVSEFGTERVHALPAEASLKDCWQLMESQQVRRVPVVDENRTLIGIVSLADLAQEMEDDKLGRTLDQISDSDTRQLYSEVNEDDRTGKTVTQVDQAREQRVA